MSRFRHKLDQAFQANRAAELRAITKLEEGRYGPGFMFSMTLCACALAGFVLVYIVFR
jgi:hypothetical protein